jgi:hypothetical protein
MSHATYDAEHWRKRAKEARAQAEQMPTLVAKRQLLDIAMAYDQLAKLAEKQKPRSM